MPRILRLGLLHDIRNADGSSNEDHTGDATVEFFFDQRKPY